jgi:hypothetical protein
MKEKAIIFDAGTLISFSMNGLIDELEELKKHFKGKFLITKEVKYEVIDHPIKIKRFELEAMNIQRLMNEGTIEIPSSLGISDETITKNSQDLMSIANSTFTQGNKQIHLVELGETSSLSLSKILTEKGIENIIAIDERTMRMLCEKPENLRDLYKKKFHMPISYKKENLKHFQGFKVIRSCELIYVAYKKGLTDLKGKKALEAYLYALRYKGCSVSSDEIKEMVKYS